MRADFCKDWGTGAGWGTGCERIGLLLSWISASQGACALGSVVPDREGKRGEGGEDERERRKERKGVVTGNMKRGRGSGMVQEVGGGEVW